MTAGTDAGIDLAMTRRLIRVRWPVLVVVAVLGALAGGAASLVLSPGYESTSKVLLQGDRTEEQLLGEAQIAMSLVVLDRTATALGWGGTGADLRGEVTATPLDGNVVQVRGTAATPERARQLTERATAEYLAFSGQIAASAADATSTVTRRSRDTAQQTIDAATLRIAELQAQPDPSPQQLVQLDELRKTAAEARKELDNIARRTQEEQLSASLAQAGTSVIEPAVEPTGAASPTLAQLVVGGAVLAFAAGLLLHLVLLRTDRRLRHGPEVAAALGAPVLGTVDVVPDGATGAGGRLARLLGDDRRWVPTQNTTPATDAEHVLSLRRALDRLRTGRAGPLDLLVLVPSGDAVAGRAAALLTAAAGPQPVPPRVVDVDVARPSVPDAEPGAATVVVVTAGTRTGWELVAISTACADAGRPPDGVVLAVAVAGARAADPDEPTAAPADDVVAVAR